MKTYPRVSRRDSTQDHSHKLPGGEGETQGMLAKPDSSSRAGLHSHLYVHETVTHETGVAYDEPGHTHETILGDTTGPKKIAEKA